VKVKVAIALLRLVFRRVKVSLFRVFELVGSIEESGGLDSLAPII